MNLVNHTRERLERGEVVLGLSLRHTRNVEICRILKGAGYDWFMLDLEHGAMSIETAQQISCTALDVGITAMVRVPEGDHALAARMLDGGALGIIMPHVETAEEARRIVDQQKYAPLGHRANAGPMVHFSYAFNQPDEMLRTINALALVVVMIESPRAVDNADEIAAVPGVDVLLVGSGDLSAELGVPNDAGHPTMMECQRKVIAACRKHGKWAGCAGIGSEQLFREHIELGSRLVIAGTDTGMLRSAAAARARALRPTGG